MGSKMRSLLRRGGGARAKGRAHDCVQGGVRYKGQAGIWQDRQPRGMRGVRGAVDEEGRDEECDRKECEKERTGLFPGGSLD